MLTSLLFDNPSLFWSHFEQAPALRRSENGYEAELYLPGLESSDVDVTFKDGYVNIRTPEVKLADKYKGSRWLIKERSRAAEHYRFSLPEDADFDNVNASLKEGVLNITVGFKAEARPRKIEIK